MSVITYTKDKLDQLLGLKANTADVAGTYLPMMDLLTAVSAATPLTAGKVQLFDATTGAITNSQLPALSSVNGKPVYAFAKSDTGPNPVVQPFADGDATVDGDTSITARYRGTVYVQPVTSPAGKFWRVINHVRSDGTLLNTFVPKVGGLVFNIVDFGAKHFTESTTAINAAIAAANAAVAAGAAAATVWIPTGSYYVKSQLTAPSAGVTIMGDGSGSNLIVNNPQWDGSASIFTITAKYVTIKQLRIVGGQSTTTSSNAAITSAINITGAQRATLKDLDFDYVNGWCIEGLGSSTSGLQCLAIDNIRGFNNASGIHLKGHSGSTYAIQGHLSKLNLQLVTVGDVLWFEDAYDVQVSQINACVYGTSATGRDIRITGQCASIYVDNLDIGSAPVTPSAAAVVLIESNGNGSPDHVVFETGIVQCGLVGVDVEAGTSIYFNALKIQANGTHGAVVNGTAKNVNFRDCTFAQNGKTAGTNYDVQINTLGRVRVIDGQFYTPQGTASGQVTRAVDIKVGFSNNTEIRSCAFEGTGFTPGVVFSSNGLPKYVRKCPGYGPAGGITVTVPATGVASSGSHIDRWFYVTAGTGGCTLGINGTTNSITITVAAGATVPVFVPAGCALIPSYTNAPTWVVFAD